MCVNIHNMHICIRVYMFLCVQRVIYTYIERENMPKWQNGKSGWRSLASWFVVIFLFLKYPTIAQITCNKL